MKRRNTKSGIFEEVCRIVRKVPSGKVATYGQIASILGNFRLSRVVGYAMSGCPYDDVPCHRIINRFGELSRRFGEGGGELQKYLLEKEGIKFDENNRINLKNYQWEEEETEI